MMLARAPLAIRTVNKLRFCRPAVDIARVLSSERPDNDVKIHRA